MPGLLLAIVVALAAALLQVALPVEASAAVRRTETRPATQSDVIAEVNRLRRGRGLDPLRMAAPVGGVARARATSMDRLGYFGHTSPRGKDAGDLLRGRGLRHRRWGEAIGRTRRMGLDAGGRWIVDWWMRSPVHRGLLLGRGVETAGVGIARHGAWTLWTIVLVS